MRWQTFMNSYFKSGLVVQEMSSIEKLTVDGRRQVTCVVVKEFFLVGSCCNRTRSSRAFCQIYRACAQMIVMAIMGRCLPLSHFWFVCHPILIHLPE